MTQTAFIVHSPVLRTYKSNAPNRCANAFNTPRPFFPNRCLPSAIVHDDGYAPCSGDFISNSATDSELLSYPTYSVPIRSIAEEDATVGGTGDMGGSAGGGGGGFGDSGSADDDSLPDDVRDAIASGVLSAESLKRYYQALQNPITKLFMTIPAFRSRFLADSAFVFKLLVQELVGNGTALASEIAVRGKDIVHELEYVASDLIVGTVVEAAFVWLLAPTLAVSSSSTSSAISKYLASLPSNFFQPSTALQTFSPSQRIASFFYAGAQYALIGFVAGIIGTAITYGIIETRKQLDRKYKPERPLPAVLPNSAAWGAFMALSSNTRFQIVEGMELGIARLFAGKADSLVNASIIALRFGNNYWGGVQFVKFFRFLGLHATGENETAH